MLDYIKHVLKEQSLNWHSYLYVTPVVAMSMYLLFLGWMPQFWQKASKISFEMPFDNIYYQLRFNILLLEVDSKA